MMNDGTTTTSGANERGQLTGESPRFSGVGSSFDYDAAGNPTLFRGAAAGVYNINNQPGGNIYNGNSSPTASNFLITFLQ